MTRAVRQRRRLAVLLGAVAGGVDAIGYVTLFRLFTAHMTGNTDGFAVALAHGSELEALRHFSPIPVFVAGIVAGGVLTRLVARRGVRGSHTGPLLLELIVLIAYWAVAPHARLGTHEAPTPAYFALAAMPAFAMGLQSAALRRIGDHGIRTTFITGMLCVAGEQGIEWWLARRARLRSGGAPGVRERSAAARARVGCAIWAAYAAGGLACATAQERAGFASLALPLVGLAIAVGLELRVARSSPDVR